MSSKPSSGVPLLPSTVYRGKPRQTTALTFSTNATYTNIGKTFTHRYKECFKTYIHISKLIYPSTICRVTLRSRKSDTCLLYTSRCV